MLTRNVSKPASFARSTCAFASARTGTSGAFSPAPKNIVESACAAAGATSAQAHARTTSRTLMQGTLDAIGRSPGRSLRDLYDVRTHERRPRIERRRERDRERLRAFRHAPAEVERRLQPADRG